MSWWRADGAYVGPAAGDLALLETGEEPLYDLGNALMALHRVGAAACEAVSRGPIPDECSLMQALETARGAFAEPMVDSVSKSLGDATYAGLLVRDVFDDAEQGALSLFRAATARGVPPTMAAQRAGLVFGVPQQDMTPYLKIAADPRSHPVAVTDAADRVLFAHVAKVCTEETEDRKQEFGKAPAAQRPRDGSAEAKQAHLRQIQRTGQVGPYLADPQDFASTSDRDVAEAVMRQALGQDDPSTPYYDARDSGGRFTTQSGDGGRKATPAAAAPTIERQPGESMVAFLLRRRQAGPPVDAPAQPEPQQRQQRQQREQRAQRQQRAEPEPAERTPAERTPAARTKAERTRAPRAKTLVVAERVKVSPEPAPLPDQLPYGKRGQLMEKPERDHGDVYVPLRAPMAVPMHTWRQIKADRSGQARITGARNFLNRASGDPHNPADVQRFRLGWLTEEAAVPMMVHDTHQGDLDTSRYHEEMAALADDVINAAISKHGLPTFGHVTARRVGDKVILDPFALSQEEQKVAEAAVDAQGIKPGHPDFARLVRDARRQIIHRPSDDGSGDMYLVHLPGLANEDEFSITEFIVPTGARVRHNPGQEMTEPKADPNQALAVDKSRSAERFWDPVLQVFRKRVYLRFIDEEVVANLEQQFGKADLSRTRATDAELAEQIMRQALAMQDDPATPYYDARDTGGRFAAAQQRTQRTQRQQREQRAQRAEAPRVLAERVPAERQAAERTPADREVRRVLAERTARAQNAPTVPMAPPKDVEYTLAGDQTYMVMSQKGMYQAVKWFAQPGRAKNPQKITVRGTFKSLLLGAGPADDYSPSQVVSGAKAMAAMRYALDEELDSIPRRLVDRIYVNPDEQDSLDAFRTVVDQQFAKHRTLRALDIEQTGDFTYRLYGHFTQNSPPPVQLIRFQEDVWENPDAEMELVYEGEVDARKITTDFRDDRPDAHAGPFSGRVDAYVLRPKGPMVFDDDIEGASAARDNLRRRPPDAF